MKMWPPTSSGSRPTPWWLSCPTCVCLPKVRERAANKELHVEVELCCRKSGMKLCFMGFQVLHLYAIVIPHCDRLWLNTVVILSRPIFISHIYSKLTTIMWSCFAFHYVCRYVWIITCLILLFKGHTAENTKLSKILNMFSFWKKSCIRNIRCDRKSTTKVYHWNSMTVLYLHLWNLFVFPTRFGSKIGSKLSKHCQFV